MNAPATQAKGQDPQQLINNIANTYSAIERGDWVAGGLGIANTAMGMVGMASNPLSGFLSAGFSWAIQHVDFLREPFDILLGSPESITRMAQTYRSAGQQVQEIATEYKRICVSQTREWQGRAADSYRAAAQKHAGGLESLAKATHGIAAAVEGAGQLVASVRKQIMDLISQAVADMVMKIIQWLAASILTFGAAIAGAIADIVSTAVRYAQKLADFLQKLLGSVQKLMNLIKQVQQIAKVAEQVIDAISALAHKGAGGGGGGVNRPTSGGLGLTRDQMDQASAGVRGEFSRDAGGYGGGRGGGGGGAPIREYEGYQGGGGGYQGGGTNTAGGGHLPPGYRPPGSQDGGAGGSVGGHVYPSPGGHGYPSPGGHSGGAGSGSGGVGSGSGQGRWVPGHWEPDTTTTAGGNTQTKPPSFGSTPITTPTSDWYRPTSESTSAAGGGGGGGGGGIPKGMGGGGGGGIPAGAFGGGPAGGGGGGTSMQHGGAAGVMPMGAGGPAAGGAVPHGPAGGGAGGAGAGMMGGAPMAGAAGQQGGSNEHKRKVRIEGDALVEPPKAAKPVIGE